jgi:hypothetical protein
MPMYELSEKVSVIIARRINFRPNVFSKMLESPTETVPTVIVVVKTSPPKVENRNIRSIIFPLGLC